MLPSAIHLHFTVIKILVSTGNMADSADRINFLSWKYEHYLLLVKIKDKNVVVSCQLCAGVKNLSTAKSSNSNLLKRLLKQHAFRQS